MQKGTIVFFAFLFFGVITISTISNEEKETLKKDIQQHGLALEDMVTKKIQKNELRNYHLEEMGCSDCHGEQPKIGKDTQSTVKLVEENINVLCSKCHEGDNLHPVSVEAAPPGTNIKVPDFLPLGTRGINKGKITCITCHAIHLQDAINYLLRGFPLNRKEVVDISIIESERKTFFQERQDLCKACHDVDFIKKNPHNRQTKSCKFCHAKDPNESANIDDTFKNDILKLCNFCHAKKREAHYLSVNPFYDKELKKEINKLGIVLIDGKIVCVSCHDPHGETELPHALRDNYVSLAEKSNRINPHWTGVFCYSCHKREESKLGFKFNGDYNKICNWCHETKEARGNIHPIGIVPTIREGLRIPKEFPLQAGRLTCMTCHNARIQEKNDKKTQELNENFLIGFPYKDKNEMCFKCHIRKNFNKINAHDQISDEGEISEENCVYCHTSRPDRKVEGMDYIDPTIEDLTYLCIRCHDESVHPAKVNHLLKMPEEKLRRKHQYESVSNVLYPLDARGRIFCGTCHNVHESGIVKSNRASKGSDVSQRIRLPLLKGELCLVCHNKDAGGKEQEDELKSEKESLD